jgi:predicted RNase H-like nuclease (RuvC/YqgF family)
MENAFGLLEEKVRKAAELVTRLRRDNKSLEDELGQARGRLQEAERRVSALEGQAAGAASKGRERDAAEAELKGLRREREEVRRRIAGLLEILDGLE